MKKLYKQFNRLDIEMDVQPMEVNELEKARVKRTVLKGKKKTHVIRNISVAAAFLVASSLTFSLAFPTLAAKLHIVGNLFDVFIEDNSYIFENYDTHTTDIGVTRESNGISVTVTDAVYDKENITIAYTIKSDKDLGERPVLEGKLDAIEFNNMYKHYGSAPKHITKKISENEYAGLFVYQLINGPKPEEIHVTWAGDSILNYANVNNQFPGDWSFQLTLQALEGKTKDFSQDGITSVGTGIDVSLAKMTKTPVSTTLYFREVVDVPIAAMEDEEWRGVLIEYKVTDDLGNEYNMIHYRDTGHSSNFSKEYLSRPRLTTTLFDEAATSITITPVINIVKMVSSDGMLDHAKEPFTLEPIHVSLDK